ncbi:PLDc N-terminal domain-containing protein [Pontibacter sp. G13]|uniref:PLDc N-terminal domain-containing protein n=1 Tax=Pontibacter sp. G13 TaxID=3074898 RepID=UPI0039068FD5
MFKFIIGVVWFLITIGALIYVWRSPQSTSAKILWTLGIFFFPVLGPICWILFGDRS